MVNNIKDFIYERAKKQLIHQFYKNQKRTSKDRGYPPPSYTSDELIKYTLDKPEFHLLFDNWVRVGCLKDWTPSFDRDDDYKGYSFSNIQLVPFWMNYKRSHEDMKNGINNKQSKSVIRVNILTGEQKEFYSIRGAARESGVSGTAFIHRCLRGEVKSAYGFIWKYA